MKFVPFWDGLFWDIGAEKRYILSQNNIGFQPQDNSVSIGKNSQTKPRKNEQVQGVKITRREYDNYS